MMTLIYDKWKTWRDRNLRTSTSIVRASYAVILFLLGVSAEQLIGSIVPFNLIMLVIVAIVAVMIGNVADSLDEIRKNTAIKVEYLEYKNASDRAAVFIRARYIVENAHQKIIVLNSYDPEKPEALRTDPQPVEERANYYKSLLARVEEDGDVIYERYLQLKDGQSPAEIARSGIYEKHFSEILEYRRSGRNRRNVGFYAVPAKLQSTFVLVDNRYLIWQINELVSANPEQVQMRAVFIFEDSYGEKGKIIQPFLSFLDMVKREPGTYVLTEDHFVESAATGGAQP
jgi:hypothetical protein